MLLLTTEFASFTDGLLLFILLLVFELEIIVLLKASFVEIILLLPPTAAAILALCANQYALAETAPNSVQDALPGQLAGNFACEASQPGVSFKNTQDNLSADYLNAKFLVTSSDQHQLVVGKEIPKDASIELSVSQTEIPANGFGFIPLNIRVLKADGTPLTSASRLKIQTSLGHLALDGNTKPTQEIEVDTSTGSACIHLVAANVPGEAVVSVRSGASEVKGNIRFTPDLLEMSVVGVVEGGIGRVKINKEALTPYIQTIGFEEKLRRFERNSRDADGTIENTLEARTAFFVKGAVKGEYLLTAAYDSDKQSSQKLFSDIDPNSYYPVYGDNSSRQFEALSNSPLFVRVDKGRNHLLFGDFITKAFDEAAQLSNYNRSLTGIESYYETDYFKTKVWLSKDTLRSFIDEQPARGISGPYAIGQPNAIANSEKIELLVRHASNASLILKREVLTRFKDYDFEPFTGKVIFTKPVPSVDENFNPVTIRITYEVDAGGEKYWVGGVQTKLTIGNVALGYSHIEEKNPLAPYQLDGATAELQLGTYTYGLLEVARSQGNQLYNQNIDSFVEKTTGSTLALGGVLTDSQAQSGWAQRVELRHAKDQLEASVSAASADKGFQNSASSIQGNKTDLIAKVKYTINTGTHIELEASENKDLDSESKRSRESLTLQHTLNPKWTVEVGVNHVREEGVVGGLSTSNYLSHITSLPGLGYANDVGYGVVNAQNFNSSSAANSSNSSSGSAPRIANQYTSARFKAIGKLSDELDLTAEYEAAVDDLSRNRALIGSEYRFNDRSRLYANYELQNTLQGQVNGLNLEGSYSRQAIVGVDTQYMKNGTFFNEYRVHESTNSLDSYNALGLRNLWQYSPNLSFTTGLEYHVKSPYLSAKETTKVATTGVFYSPNSSNKISSKLELRDSETLRQWLSSFAYDAKLNEQWTGLMRNLYLNTRYADISTEGEQTQNRLQVGIAYRDTQTNHFNALARLEHRLDQSTKANDLKNNQSLIGSLHFNYKPYRRLTLGGQVAAKSVKEQFDKGNTKWLGTLVAGKVSVDLTEKIDLSILASKSQSSASSVTGYGAELGFNVVKNVWLGASYTVGKYSDVDLYSANASWSGWHLRFNMKFD